MVANVEVENTMSVDGAVYQNEVMEATCIPCTRRNVPVDEISSSEKTDEETDDRSRCQDRQRTRVGCNWRNEGRRARNTQQREAPTGRH